MLKSSGVRSGIAIALAILAIILLRIKPWQHTAVPRTASGARIATLNVAFLPVTCHLTCPVTDYASKTSDTGTRFNSKLYEEFPPIADAMKAGSLQAAFMIVPLAMKLREQGVPVRICYLGHRDGSTVMVAKDSTARSLADLRGKTMAIPSLYSNQNFVIHKLMADQGLKPSDIHFVVLPPPDMPTALGNHSIDSYFVGEPFAAQAELDGTGRVLYEAKDIWPGFISCALVVREDLIKTHPEIVRDLVRGIAESGDWAETHRMEAAKLVAPYYRQNEKLIQYVLMDPGRVSYLNLTPTDKDLQTIEDMGLQMGILKKHTPMSDLIDRSFIPDTITPANIALSSAHS